MELKLEELEADAAEDALAAEQAAASAGDTTVQPYVRRKPARKQFPAHLPRERVVAPGPTACACCGSTWLAKPGEDVTETLEVIRDDRPFGGRDPPAAVFRTGEHPERHLQGYGGILQADAYAGFNRLYDGARKPGPLIEAACWSHSRRKFFVLADVTARARGSWSLRRSRSKR